MATPDEVLPYLYIGGKSHAKDKEGLQKLGINVIVNVSEEIRNYFQKEPMFQYLQCPVQDTSESRLDPFFEEACEFIDSARKLGHGVLIHCSRGVSRSATITMAYLIYSESLTLIQAYQVLRRVRDIVKPKPNFLKQLAQFERRTQQKKKQKSKLVGSKRQREDVGIGHSRPSSKPAGPAPAAPVAPQLPPKKCSEEKEGKVDDVSSPKQSESIDSPDQGSSEARQTEGSEDGPKPAKRIRSSSNDDVSKVHKPNEANR